MFFSLALCEVSDRKRPEAYLGCRWNKRFTGRILFWNIFFVVNNGHWMRYYLLLLQLTRVLSMFDSTPPINSQASASQLSQRGDNWSPVTWYQPTADSTGDLVATGESTGVSMATEVWSRTVPQSRSQLECSAACSNRPFHCHSVAMATALVQVDFLSATALTNRKYKGL